MPLILRGREALINKIMPVDLFEFNEEGDMVAQLAIMEAEPSLI